MAEPCLTPNPPNCKIQLQGGCFKPPSFRIVCDVIGTRNFVVKKGGHKSVRLEGPRDQVVHSICTYNFSVLPEASRNWLQSAVIMQKVPEPLD